MIEVLLIDGDCLLSNVVDGDGSLSIACDGECETFIINGDCSLSTVVNGDGSLTIALDGECETFLPVASGGEYYTGETVVTPTQETQILRTANKLLASDITINPIPSNYGRIIYNGAYLRVE